MIQKNTDGYTVRVAKYPNRLFADEEPSHSFMATDSFLNPHYGDWLPLVSIPAQSYWINQVEILLKFDVCYVLRKFLDELPLHNKDVFYNLIQSLT